MLQEDIVNATDQQLSVKDAPRGFYIYHSWKKHLDFHKQSFQIAVDQIFVVFICDFFFFFLIIVSFDLVEKKKCE